MSTAATNQTGPASTSAVAVPLPEAIAPAVQAELTSLRNELAATNARLAWLENSVTVLPTTRQLVAPNSSEIRTALELTAEVFPGSETEIETECDPAEPGWPWYSLTIYWNGASEEVIDRQLLLHRRLAEAHPDLRDQVRLCICQR
ncbi:hypothetical protein [Anatilimnocola floriformis]|uniref:hypothetical protein n=1 Tax=Anatilimnocola floriformis TaxID=2948575 RepID=UPI0020C53F81|nr:hypothetical protein [Anatilimnocola floriformis]